MPAIPDPPPARARRQVATGEDLPRRRYEAHGRRYAEPGCEWRRGKVGHGGGTVAAWPSQDTTALRSRRTTMPGSPGPVPRSGGPDPRSRTATAPRVGRAMTRLHPRSGARPRRRARRGWRARTPRSRRTGDAASAAAGCPTRRLRTPNARIPNRQARSGNAPARRAHRRCRRRRRPHRRHPQPHRAGVFRRASRPPRTRRAARMRAAAPRRTRPANPRRVHPPGPSSHGPHRRPSASRRPDGPG